MDPVVEVDVDALADLAALAMSSASSDSDDVSNAIRNRRVSEVLDGKEVALLGVLKIEVIGAKGFPRRWMRKQREFVQINVGIQTFRTAVMDPNRRNWNHELRLPINELNLGYDVGFSVFVKKRKVGSAHLNIVDVKAALRNEPGCTKLYTLSLEPETRLFKTDKDLRSQGEEREYDADSIGSGFSGLSNLELQLRITFLDKAQIHDQFILGLWAYFSGPEGRMDENACMAMVETLAMAPNDDQFSRLWSIASRGNAAIECKDFLRALDVLAFQESGVLQRLLGFLDYGEEFVHYFVMGGFLSAQDMSQQALDKGRILVLDRRSGRVIEEYIPGYVLTSLRLMYQTRMGRSTRVRDTLRRMSEKEGEKMNSPQSALHIAGFVKLHSINVDEVEKPLTEYSTFNQFFSRRLRKGARIDESRGRRHIAICPADSRLMAFEDWNHACRLWIKGAQYDISGLLGPKCSYLASYFDACIVVISRLAPQDYHRWHMPCHGTIKRITPIDGHYFTVNPIAVRNESFDIFTQNKRVVCEVMTEEFGLIVVIAVGATLVGSIDIYAREAQTLNAFDEFGCFYFGGSTVVVLFQPGVIRIETDLLRNSSRPIETLVKMGQCLGTGLGQKALLNSENYDTVTTLSRARTPPPPPPPRPPLPDDLAVSRHGQRAVSH